MNKKRYIYLDILKILASIGVVLIHVCSVGWYEFETTSFNWKVINIYDSLFRWSVPIFMMVTGAHYFDKKENNIKANIKYLKKITIVLVVWSSIYYICSAVANHTQVNLSSAVDGIIKGNYHLWYLYFLINFYLFAPIIKQIIKDKKIKNYYLILWFVINLCTATFINLPIFNKLANLFTQLGFSFVCNLFGYYILGNCIHNEKLNKKQLKYIYVTCILSFIIIICGTYYLRVNNIVEGIPLYKENSFTVLFTAVGIYCFIKEKFNNRKFSKKFKLIVNKWTKLTFGVYLIHPLIIEIIDVLGFSMLNNFNILSILIYTIIVYILSVIPIYIISKIPVLNKYII